MRRFRRSCGLLWPAVGLVGSLLTTAASTRLLARQPIRWWWEVPLRDHHDLLGHLLWLGVALLCIAWVGIGSRLLSRRDARARDVVGLAALWATPFAFGPALFSQDMWSYLAQGEILHLGLNPYHVAPLVLRRHGQAALLRTVSSIWRKTPAPYGPVFLALADGVETVAHGHLGLALELMRVPEIAGLALLAVFLPRVARSAGADPARAVWLVLASPLTLLYLVAGGHNDALMAGLTVAGVSLALDGRPLPGLALCTLAAMVKLPAAAALVVVGICWLRAEPGRWRQIVASATAMVAGLVALAGLGTGLGLSWISGSLISTPEVIRLPYTPATAVAVTGWEIAHGAGRDLWLGSRSVNHAVITVAMVLVVLFAVWLCLRVRRETMPRSLGLMLLAAAIGGPAAWPWYLIWGVSLLAADPRAQRSRWLVALLVVSAFAVHPGGEVPIPLAHTYEVAIAFGLLALGVIGSLLWAHRGRARRPVRAPDHEPPAISVRGALGPLPPAPARRRAPAAVAGRTVAGGSDGID